jgi:hypothetical protein
VAPLSTYRISTYLCLHWQAFTKTGAGSIKLTKQYSILFSFVKAPILSQMQQGLPDGIFSYQKRQLWFILEGLAMNNFGVLHCHLVYSLPLFVAILYILVHIFPRFCLKYPEKSGNSG